jgi:hypothetical protein
VKGAKQIAFEQGFFDASCKMDGVEVSWEGNLIKDNQGNSSWTGMVAEQEKEQEVYEKCWQDVQTSQMKRHCCNMHLRTNLIDCVC